MNVKLTYSTIITFLIITQIICIILAQKSNKPIKKYIKWFNMSLLIPLSGNLIIINTISKNMAFLGYYLYYIGMTIVMLSLVGFTNNYCKGIRGLKTIKKSNKKQTPVQVYVIGLIDIIQLLMGLIFGYSFNLKEVSINGILYYKPIQNMGLMIHRIINYVIFLCVILIFIIAIVSTSKLYRNKFTVVLMAIVFSGVIQTVNIIFTIDIDKSTICHSIFGIIVFYLTIYYQPLKILDNVLSNIVSDMTDAVFIIDATNQCLWANIPAKKLINIEDNDLSTVEQKLVDKFGEIINKEGNWIKDLFLSETDEYYTIEKKTVKSDNYNLDGISLIIKNSTEKRRLIEQEIYNSSHDELTGLYNIRQLHLEIKKLLYNNSIKQDYYIIYMNIRNFKFINDMFGRLYGDKVLIQIGNWIKSNITYTNCSYGRLIGDTFGLIIPIDKFNEQLFTQKFSNFIVKYKNIEHKIVVHIGVYKVENITMDISTMFDRAHLAIANNTEIYKTVIQYYDEDVRQNVLNEQQLISELGIAIEENQIIPYLQPITDVNGNVVGAEALARWIHPKNGFMPPNKFIPIFEKNGHIVDVDKHIWRKVCQTLDMWRDKFNDLFISINISPKDFYYINVVDELATLVKEYDIEPKKLRVEITETAMMSDTNEIINIINKLRENGFIVEIDDFGSGYSSLSMLKDMPVDVLKIDMNFLDRSKSDISKTIVKNVINLSNDLNIVSLTEGVETEQQFHTLIDMGCVLFQGYYFAKPMPIDEFEDYITQK